jgi:gluconokinase
MVIILMGVAGSGKTTIGTALAQRLGWAFRDADEFHPKANIEKMGRGIPLDDDDRRPWLETIRASIARHISAGENAIFGCSALKRNYRELLAVAPDKVRFVYLKGSPALIAERLRTRRGHFFDPNLLRSQFDALEEPQGVIEVDIAADPEAIVDSMLAALQLCERDP